MWTPDYFIRYIALPLPVESLVIPNDDGTFDVYINSNIPQARQIVCLKHELEHIRQDHFYRPAKISQIEWEANHKPPRNRYLTLEQTEHFKTQQAYIKLSKKYDIEAASELTPAI